MSTDVLTSLPLDIHFHIADIVLAKYAGLFDPEDPLHIFCSRQNEWARKYEAFLQQRKIISLVFRQWRSHLQSNWSPVVQIGRERLPRSETAMEDTGVRFIECSMRDEFPYSSMSCDLRVHCRVFVVTCLANLSKRVASAQIEGLISEISAMSNLQSLSIDFGPYFSLHSLNQLAPTLSRLKAFRLWAKHIQYPTYPDAADLVPISFERLSILELHMPTKTLFPLMLKMKTWRMPHLLHLSLHYSMSSQPALAPSTSNMVGFLAANTIGAHLTTLEWNPRGDGIKMPSKIWEICPNISVLITDLRTVEVSVPPLCYGERLQRLTHSNGITVQLSGSAILDWIWEQTEEEYNRRRITFHLAKISWEGILQRLAEGEDKGRHDRGLTRLSWCQDLMALARKWKDSGRILLDVDESELPVTAL